MKENYKWGENIDDDRQWCEKNKKHYCEKENPWNESKLEKGVHPKAFEVGDQEDGWPGGDWITFKCPICNHSWKSELPQ